MGSDQIPYTYCDLHTIPTPTEDVFCALPDKGHALHGHCTGSAGYFATVTGTGEIDRPTWSIETQILRTVSGIKQIWRSNTRLGGEGYSP